MLKKSISSSLITPYDHYLADLFREIEEAGCCVVPAPRPSLIRRRYDGATVISEPITFTLEKQPVPTPPPPPPYPLVFSGLPVDVLPNIERAVKIYCRHIQPLRTADIQARASELYEMAYYVAEGKALALYKASVMKLPKEAREQIVAELEAKAQKNVPTIEQEPFSADIEQYLNSDVLECRGESTSGHYHLDFFVMALMQLGMLYRKIRGGAETEASPYIVGIRQSLQHGLNALRLHETLMNVKRKKSADTKKGGEAKASNQFVEAKEIFRGRFPEIREGNTSLTASQIATKIYDEIVEKNHESKKKIIIPAFSTFETWARKLSKGLTI